MLTHFKPWFIKIYRKTKHTHNKFEGRHRPVKVILRSKATQKMTSLVLFESQVVLSQPQHLTLYLNIPTHTIHNIHISKFILKTLNFRTELIKLMVGKYLCVFFCSLSRHQISNAMYIWIWCLSYEGSWKFKATLTYHAWNQWQINMSFWLHILNIFKIFFI